MPFSNVSRKRAVSWIASIRGVDPAMMGWSEILDWHPYILEARTEKAERLACHPESMKSGGSRKRGSEHLCEPEQTSRNTEGRAIARSSPWLIWWQEHSPDWAQIISSNFTVSFLYVCSSGALTAAVLLYCRTDERLHFAACDTELPSVGNVPGLAVAFLQGNSLKTLHEKKKSLG